MVFQHPALYPHLSVFDNLAFGLKARGVAGKQVRTKVNTVAGMLGLDHVLTRRPAPSRAASASGWRSGRALRAEPRVILFDEPFSSLDSPLARPAPRPGGRPAPPVRHDPDPRDARPGRGPLMGDRVVVLDRGRLLQCGTPRAIYDHPSDRFVATFVGSPPMNILPCQIERDGDRSR